MRRFSLALVIICSLTLGSAVGTASTAQAGVPRADAHPSLSGDVSGYSAYLPLIRYEYDWTQLREWTPRDPGEGDLRSLYVGPKSGWLWALGHDAAFRSTDYGETWTVFDPNGYQPALLAIDEQSDAGSPIVAASSYGTVLSSTNGISWTVGSDFRTYTTYLGWIAGQLHVGTWDGSASVLRRTGTVTWTTVGDTLPGMVSDLDVFRSELYAATRSGLYRLDGKTWNPVIMFDESTERQGIEITASSFTPRGRMASDAASVGTSAANTILVHDDTIYVGTSSSRGIYKSTDGLTWSACDVGLTGVYGVSVVDLIASQDGKLFAATLSDGVFMSANGGERWMALDDGLPHSIDGYGILLDGVRAASLALVRDEEGQQTLAAAFGEEGVRLMTVTDDTWLSDRTAQSPPKAVLVVGPIDPPDHNTTKSYIAWANRLATIMERNGMQVVKVYWPDSTWESVRAVIGNASIVVYKGHGFGLGDIPSDPTELYGSLNGFCLVDPTDPPGARLGTQDMLVTTNRLAENAIGFFHCCYCGGASASDPAPVSEALARRRIEAYGSTILRMGGGGYFALANEEAILKELFAHPDKSLGDIYRSVHGGPEHAYPHVLWPEQAVWFAGDTQRDWSQAFVGDPTLTARDVLGQWAP